MRLSIQNITKRFGTLTANDAISMDIAGGKIVGVLGENGAGKSTLMKILSGYQPADSGDVLVEKQPVHLKSPQEAIRYGIGMLHQDPLDVGAFSVVEEFMYGLGNSFSLNRRDGRAKLAEVCAKLGFSINPDAPIASLSIAARQQLAIARLIALNVQVLILDEPTTGISEDQKNSLFQALRDLAERDGLTVLLVSHKLEDVLALCDEAVVLRRGALVGRVQLPVPQAALVELMFGKPMSVERHKSKIQTNAPTMLSLQNLTIKTGRLTINHFDLNVLEGEVIGFAGLDGSGQALIMRAVAGLVRADAGKITVNGRLMNHLSYRDFMSAGVSFGAAGRLEEGLVRGLTLTEHIALATERGVVVDWKRAGAFTESQIAHYQVKGRPDSPIETLSGGNQQRVLMALMPESPAVMVLEQPTRGLDVDSARWIWAQILARREAGGCILFNSDDLDEILTYADRVVVCFAGQTRLIENSDSLDSATLGHLIGGGI
jgi:simple sugar transport system ATP-binding protein